jgi:hypothetical protein
MSQENVEVVRAIYGAFARRDGDALVRHLDPSIRVYGRPFHPDASVYEGRDFLANGPYVVVPIEQSGRGKSSAVGIEERIVNVWKLRRGKCVELRMFSTIEEAFEAVGHQA